MNLRASMRFAFLGLIILTFSTIASGLLLKNISFQDSAYNPIARIDGYEKAWKKADSLERIGLPQSAMAIVQEIYKKAKKEEHKPQYIKSILYKLKLRSFTDENAFVNSVAELKEEINQAKSPEKQILHSVIGEIYWQHYSQNRYLYIDRSVTADFDNENIATWDLNKIVSECIRHYQASLDEPELLKKEKIENYHLILNSGTNDKDLRTTVYEFLAHRAIDFFSGEEPQLIRPADQFTLNDTMFLKPVDEFVNISIKTIDSISFKFYAISLFQEVSQFQLDSKKNTSSLVDLELKRLHFVRTNSTHRLKDSVYLQTLLRLEKKTLEDPASVEVSHAVANVYYEKGLLYNPQISEEHKWDLKKAVKICNDALKRDGSAVGNSRCKELIALIKSKALNSTVESTNLPNKPFRSLISYKNVDSIYFRIYSASDEDLRKINRQVEKEEYRRSEEEILLEHFKRKPIIQSFSYALPTDNDYQTHSVEVKIPALPVGEYIILGGSSQNMSLNQEAIIYDFVSVTNISYINRTLSDGSIEFYFLSRTTGKPIANAEARLFYEDYNRINGNYQMSEGFPNTADENGYLKFAPANRNFFLKIVSGKDFFYTSSLNSYPRNPEFYQRTADNQPERSQLKTFYFTDRAIYRPGQTVYFKGIVLRLNKNNQHEIVKKQKVTVEFKDVNYQRIAELRLVSNDYGTFSGTFTAPANGMNGQMKITDDISGYHTVLVEDYKRPKFEVSLADSKESYRLEDSVHVTGLAKAFAGSNITGAEVKYRVVRNAVFPMWWYYWKGYYPTSPAMEITNGDTKTDDKGGFKISFKAIPDLSVSKESKPTYNYTLYADVTDVNGETRGTEKTISVSYLALSLGVDIPTTLFKDEIKPTTIRTTNLAGEFTAAEGTITIHKLESPERILRTRQWPVPDQYLMKEEDFVQLFPNEPYGDESNYLKWPRQRVVYEKNFNTSKNKEFDLKEAEGWEQGKYILEIKAKDKFGEEVKEVLYFTLIDKKSNETALKETDWFSVLKSTGEPGEKALFMVGTAAQEINVLFEVEHDNVIVKKEWIVLKKQQRILEIPIEEKYRGNFGVHFTFIRNNEFFKHSETITVPFTNKALSVSFETFRNKLQPGEKESWKLRVKGPNGEKVAAEMVATLYDASLNAFSANSFNFDIYNPQYTRLNWNSINGFVTSNGRLYQKNWNPHLSPLVRTYDQLNWFGFNIYYFGRSIQHALQGRIPGILIRGINSSVQSSSGEANGINVSGRVTDESGEAVPGVNVLIKGTNLGTVTDLDGRFNIKVASNRVLVFSFIGYVSQEVALGGKTNLNVKLAADVQMLSEVVVVGYGTENEQDYKPQNSLRAPKLADSAKEESIAPQKKDVVGNVAVKEDLVAVKTRTNFNETAFFYPHLETDENGDILINFTMPEALTKWKMLGFAHTRDLKFALTENELVTQKELMVVPNVPRFFREGDEIIFSIKINNLADKDLKGESQLMLFDALTMKPVDHLLRNKESIKSFETKKGQSTEVSWNLSIPEGIQAITYKVVARAGSFSDGEEMAIPVLTNRMLVTETLPLPIRSNQTKTFTLDKLINNTSSTLRNHKLTLEFTSQPAWYAIQSLPYLMEFPYECAEQTFSRFYANSIATHIANSDPKIKAVFDSWKSTANSTALLSNLEKNQELKSMMLEETPWVQEAQNETERKNRIALLFDLNKMSMELEKALRKLRKMQTGYGAWPWFEGMQPSRYITQHIVTGLGHLDHLKIKKIRENSEVWAMTTSAIRYLDKEIIKEYEQLKKDEKRGLLKMSDNHLHGEVIQYLYARSYFKDVAMSNDLKVAVNYYNSQGKTYWIKNNRYCQAMIALALNRMEDKATPSAILKSIKENAIINEEMGMYWKETWGYYWWEAPVETQAMLIEAFGEVANDQKAVDDMKVWLLKQKQTQNWQTTKATTEACYALLLRGTNWLASDALVDISLGDKKINPTKLEGAKPEAGTGYFKTSFAGSEITNEMGKVTVSKKDEGVSWGAIYWQYFEQLDKITPHKTPLTLKKQLFLEKNTDKGPVISHVKESTKLKVGDLLKVRIELVVDRDMEYVHMKDMRASGFEPLNVLSGYKYQDGLGYYESTRDAATNFFFDHLRKGTYVFEYPLRVTHKGDFSNGITTIQSMYAPEFSSHSEGVRVTIH